VVTLDEVHEAEDRFSHSTGRRVKYSKPHPYSLLRVIQEIGIPRPRCGYVGDVVDDILAANALKERFQITAIISMSARENRKAGREFFIKAGADQVITNPKDLLQLVS
jgi:phosphoglycolate phosphatase-like HAD superfamily hydrolase